jgi:hypothetical protein
MARIIPDKFAVMTVDPGGTTGCATGVFRTDKGDDMLATIFARAAKKNVIESWEVKGDSEAQSWIICNAWRDFKFKCNVEYAVPSPYTYLVIEDFALRELQAQLQSVEVKAGIKTLLLGDDPTRIVDDGPVLWPLGKPEFQTPSTAKRRNNAMLKELGLWVVGSEHERDARRHLVAKVNDILDGKS